jgi:putative membrane protein
MQETSPMLWVKSLHIIFVVTWFAGLFYLPRLFVYHATATDAPSIERFKVMERKLYYGIMAPSAVLAVVFGSWLWLGYGIGQGQRWMLAKLALVVLLIVYHLYCGMLLDDFRHHRNTRSPTWFRWFNEAPVLVLVGAVILVVVKPF